MVGFRLGQFENKYYVAISNQVCSRLGQFEVRCTVLVTTW